MLSPNFHPWEKPFLNHCPTLQTSNPRISSCTSFTFSECHFTRFAKRAAASQVPFAKSRLTHLKKTTKTLAQVLCFSTKRPYLAVCSVAQVLPFLWVFPIPDQKTTCKHSIKWPLYKLSSQVFSTLTWLFKPQNEVLYKKLIAFLHDRKTVPKWPLQKSSASNMIYTYHYLSTMPGEPTPFFSTKQLFFSALYGTQTPSKRRRNPNVDWKWIYRITLRVREPLD